MLNLSETQIKTWYQNRRYILSYCFNVNLTNFYCRTKWKRQNNFSTNDQSTYVKHNQNVLNAFQNYKNNVYVEKSNECDLIKQTKINNNQMESQFFEMKNNSFISIPSTSFLFENSQLSQHYLKYLKLKTN